jgi:glyoxylase-like metal-dependent hydrolase (beta-lactamase superfamily II)
LKLNLIRGHTFYLDTGQSLIGVYRLPDSSCVLIDSGDRAGNAKVVLDTLQDEGLQVQGIINTHAHADHCAANHRIQEATNCSIYASGAEGCFIEDPVLGLYCLYSAQPIRMLKNRYLLAEPSRVTHKLGNDLNLNSEWFTILDLKGHSAGHIGVVTPDGVLFAGDSMLHPDILKDFAFLYMADIAGQLQTLATLKQRPEMLFLTHGGLVRDAASAIRLNQDRLEFIMDSIRTLLVSPLTREQIVERTANRFGLKLNRTQYFLVSASIAAFLSYLCNHKEIVCQVENNVLIFTK